MTEEDKKGKIYQICKNIIIVVCSFFATLSLFMGKGLNIDYSKQMLMTIVCIVCIILFKKIADKNIKIKGTKIVALILTFFKYCQLISGSGNYIHIVDTFSKQTKLSIVLLIGYFCIYLAIIHYIYIALNKLKEKNEKETKKSKILNYIFDKRTFIMICVILLILWLPHIIIQFPASVEWDSDAEIAKFMEVSGEIFSSHYPPVHIWLLGIIITTSEKLFQNTNPGFFLLTMINVIIGAMAFANTFVTMKKLKTPYVVRTILLLMYAILPVFIGNIIPIVKDNLYGLAMLLLVTALIEYVIDEENFWKNLRTVLTFILSAVLLILTRNNGIHVVVITLAIMLIKICIEKKMTIKKFALIIIPIFIGVMLIQIVTVTYNVLPGEEREKYPFFLQQSGRYIKYYKDEISEEEKQILNKTLDFDKVGELYNPTLADPVKDTFRGISLDYFKVYIQEFFKHPMVYVEATANLVYPIFVPDIVWGVNTNFASTFWGNKMEETQIEGLKAARENLGICYKSIAKLPVINMLSSSATYVCMLFVILVFLINDKRYKEIFVFIPLLLTILVLIISPVACARYCYPITFSVPTLVAMYVRNLNTKKQ